MRVEVLYVPDCPHHPAAVAQLRNALLAEGMAIEIHEVAVKVSRISHHQDQWT